MRQSRSWAINRRPVTVEDYGPDPRGTNMFLALTGVNHTAVDGHDGHVYTGDRGSAQKTFNGDLGGDAQRFTGAAALSLYGAAKPIAGGNAFLGQGKSLDDALADPGLRIFAARAARKASGS